MPEIEEMGPIDWVLIEFDRPLTGAAAPPLLDLVDRGLIRILDILYIEKQADGTVVAVDFSSPRDGEAAALDVFVGASSGLLGDDDIKAAGEAMDPDRRAVLLVYENAWAAPFAIAVREAGGMLVDHGRIPTQALIAALDELEALESSAS